MAAPLHSLSFIALTRPPSVHMLLPDLAQSAQPCPSEPERTRPDTKNSLKSKKREKTVSQEKDNGRSPPFGSPFHPWLSTRDVIVWTQCDMGQSFRRRIAFN